MMSSQKLQGPAAEYKHEEHIIRNINREFQEKQTYLRFHHHFERNLRVFIQKV